MSAKQILVSQWVSHSFNNCKLVFDASFPLSSCYIQKTFSVTSFFWGLILKHFFRLYSKKLFRLCFKIHFFDCVLKHFFDCILKTFFDCVLKYIRCQLFNPTWAAACWKLAVEWTSFIWVRIWHLFFMDKNIKISFIWARIGQIFFSHGSWVMGHPSEFQLQIL